MLYQFNFFTRRHPLTLDENRTVSERIPALDVQLVELPGETPLDQLFQHIGCGSIFVASDLIAWQKNRVYEGDDGERMENRRSQLCLHCHDASIVNQMSLMGLVSTTEPVTNLQRFELMRDAIKGFTRDPGDGEPVRQSAHVALANMLAQPGFRELIDFRDVYGMSLLEYAMAFQDQRAMLLLIGYGANVNTSSLLMETPLHFAVKQGFISAVRILLQHGSHPNAYHIRMETPLQMAQRLHDGAETTEDLECYADILKVFQATQPVYDQLDEYHKQWGNMGHTILHHVLLNGDRLLEEARHEDYVEFVSAHRNLPAVNFQKDFQTAPKPRLDAKAKKIQAEIDALLDAGVSANVRNNQMLTPVMLYGALGLSGGKILSDRLLAATNLSLQSRDGGTVYEIALRRLNFNVLAHVMKFDLVRDNYFTQNRVRIFKFAYDNGGLSSVLQLLNYYRFYMFQNQTTVLHLAAEIFDAGLLVDRNRDLFSALIEEQTYLISKEDVNATDMQGETAVFIAIRLGKTELTELLADENADFTVINNNGEFPFDVAVQNGDPALIQAVGRKTSDFLEEGPEDDAQAKLLKRVLAWINFTYSDEDWDACDEYCDQLEAEAQEFEEQNILRLAP